MEGGEETEGGQLQRNRGEIHKFCHNPLSDGTFLNPEHEQKNGNIDNGIMDTRFLSSFFFGN